MTTANEGTYKCPQCGTATPHGPLLHEMDTDKLFRMLIEAGGHDLKVVNMGGFRWQATIVRRWTTYESEIRGTVNLTLRDLARSLDPCPVRDSQERKQTNG